MGPFFCLVFTANAQRGRLCGKEYFTFMGDLASKIKISLF